MCVFKPNSYSLVEGNETIVAVIGIEVYMMIHKWCVCATECPIEYKFQFWNLQTKAYSISYYKGNLNFWLGQPCYCKFDTGIDFTLPLLLDTIYLCARPLVVSLKVLSFPIRSSTHTHTHTHTHTKMAEICEKTYENQSEIYGPDRKHTY